MKFLARKLPKMSLNSLIILSGMSFDLETFLWSNRLIAVDICYLLFREKLLKLDSKSGSLIPTWFLDSKASQTAFQNGPKFWWTCGGISFWVVFKIIFYHPKWNLISVKITNMKSIPALGFKSTCALNATSSKPALIHFVSGKLCSPENIMLV